MSTGIGSQSNTKRQADSLQAAELWIQSCEAADLERTTIAAYEQHAREC
jgi:hypothetical protein